jgi:chromosome segregation ATPase
MGDETTQNMNGSRSFEERVFARFDALDSTLKDLDARLQKLEDKSYDTKPIWERALAEILAVSHKLDTVERKLNVPSQDMLTLRADQTRIEDRMDKIESKPVQ